MAAISARGSSDNWTRRKNDVVRILGVFRATEPKQEWKWNGMTAEFLLLPKNELLERKMYEAFGDWQAKTYIIQSGKHKGKPYAAKNVVNNLTTALNMAMDLLASRNELNDSDRFFFGCLDASSSSEPARWLNGLKKNIRRFCFERDAKEGNEMDHSADPIYFDEMEAMVKAYSLADTPGKTGGAYEVRRAVGRAGGGSYLYT